MLPWQVVQPVIVLENAQEFHEQKLHLKTLDRFYISCDQTARSVLLCSYSDVAAKKMAYQFLF